MDADEKNMQEFMLLRDIYDATLWNTPKQEAFLTYGRRTRLLRECLKIAAVFILAFGCFYFLMPEQEDVVEPEEIAMQTIYVPEGQRAEIFLADGTKVWLNGKTSLSFPNRFTHGERRVELDGEAYFDVKKDASEPFIVSCEDYRVKVLGTEFNVKAYRRNGRFETALLKGSVEIISDHTNEKTHLTPGTRVYAKEGNLVLAALRNEDQFLWREGIIAFENESVRDILCKLELYFDVQIDVRNTKILDVPYTGKFRTNDGVEHALKVLQLRHKFTYTKDYETNIFVIR